MTRDDNVAASTDWLTLFYSLTRECLCVTDSHRVRYTCTESALVSVAFAAPPLNEPVKKDDVPCRTILHIAKASL